MADPNGKLVTPTGFNQSGVHRALELDVNDYLLVSIASGALIVVPHNLLDGVQDQDTVAAAVVAGDTIIGNATPKWDRLAKGVDGQLMAMLAGLPAWVNPYSLVVPVSGWINASAWVFVSASSFKIVGVDQTAVYKAGTKLRWKDGAGYKYGHVLSSSFAVDTTVSIIVNTLHVLGGGAITDNYYSYSDPADFPTRFTYAPVWAASGVAPTIGNGTLNGYYSIEGKLCLVSIYHLMGGTTTFGTGTYSWGFPFTSSAQATGAAEAFDAGTAFHIGVALHQLADNSFGIVSENAGNIWSQTIPHTWAVNDYIYVSQSCWL
jgi:hypothetical protein